MTIPTFENLDPETFDKYIDRATDELVASVRLPLSEEVWETDKYADMIYDKAKELYEEEHNVDSRK